MDVLRIKQNWISDRDRESGGMDERRFKLANRAGGRGGNPRRMRSKLVSFFSRPPSVPPDLESKSRPLGAPDLPSTIHRVGLGRASPLGANMPESAETREVRARIANVIAKRIVAGGLEGMEQIIKEM